MKIQFLILTVFWLCLETPGWAASLSETNNGVYIGFAGLSNEPGGGYVGTETLRFDDRLLWCPFFTNGSASLNYPHRYYGVRVTMHGPDGKEVAKTAVGKSYGVEFDKVRGYQDVVRGWSMGSIEAQGPYDPRGGGFTGGPPLPAPKELFQMDKPGVYTLDIEMQLFQIVKKSGSWSRNLLRFGPVRIQVEKPEQKAKSSG
jgi:hypothetical protein